ncbi:MAG: SH3 domain-containing protein [Geminicoccaceae bacterium]|nr:SH3 domain-containing protein [Geminicoccaceae bacterium]
MRTAGRTVARPAVPPPAAPVKVQPLGATYRVARRAHLRRGPSTREPALAVLAVGTLVQAVGRVEGADWLEVRFGRSRGFVQADLLRPTATGAGGDEAALPAEPAPSGAAAPGTEGAGP